MKQLMKEMQADVYLANFLISQMTFEQLLIIDEYLFWMERFDIKYDYKAYAKLRKTWGMISSYDLLFKERFVQEREKQFNYFDLLLKREIRN